MHIRVDMDFGSSPLWLGTNGTDFINCELDELNISKPLKRSLTFYHNVWYNFQNAEISYDTHHESLKKVNLFLEDLAVMIAKSLKKELPNSHIYVWDNKNSMNKEVI